MECNKEEAIRAKELAEKKFLEMDIAGAKRFALKAQNFYPNLDGLSQLLATLEVYVSAEKRINGEVDWYKVLGVEPLADDDTIRRRYKKLALTLHPDKNKSVGAGGAFKLLSQACKLLLSNKAQNRKRILRSIYEETPNWKSSVPASQNGFFDFFNNGNGKPSEPVIQNGFFDFDSTRNRNSSVPISQNGLLDFFNTGNGKDRTVDHSDPTPTSSVSWKPTFWTICSACKKRFEYQRVYINWNLVCAFCHQHFWAVETSAAPMYHDSSSSSIIYQIQRQKFKSTRLEINSHVLGRMPASASNSSEQLFGSGPLSMPDGICSLSTSASSVPEAHGAYVMLSEHLKRRNSIPTIPPTQKEAHFGEIYAVETTADGSDFQSSCFGSNSVLKADRPRKKRHFYERRVDIHRGEMEFSTASRNEVTGCAGSLETGRFNGAGFCKRNGMRGISLLQSRNMLIEKAREEIHSKLKEWGVASESRNLDKLKNNDKEAKEEDKERTRNSLQPDSEESNKSSATMGKNSQCANFGVCASEATDSSSMSVPDPDFHDFDKDRTEKSFGGNQVWAVYDDDDGMPRYYALIHSVISLKPFKLKISWLNSKSNDELAPIKWVNSGFPKTTGDFRIGKHVSNGSFNSFSHRVNSTRGIRGSIHVYPKKGDTWALYTNWSLDWNEFTADEIIHKYDMAEVLEDYNEEQGVNVAPLVKVAGFKTVFRRHADPRKVRNIPREEMFRFSHQVPSYMLTSQEGLNAPKGCLELDPAALPMELLQVVKEVENSLGQREKGSVEDIPREGVVAETMEKKESRVENLIVYKRKRIRQRDSSKVASDN